MNKLRTFTALVLAVMMTVLMIPSALAAGDETSESTSDAKVLESCVVLGADLNDDQIATVYKAFGVERGSVTELKVTNSEEREYLEGKVSDSTIGSRSISCIYIEILEAGAGLTVSCSNINWCTENVYNNALTTAGIYDANVIVAAPFAVSGTAALTGIYKAYETVTGNELDEKAKDTAVDELIVTSDLADDIGDADATQIVNELKLMLNETAAMTDDELKTEIQSIAKEYGVSLTDDEISQLVSLCRQMEKLNVSELTEKVQAVQDTVAKIQEAAEKVNEAKDTATGFIARVSSFFSSISSFFKGIFGGK